MAVVNVNTVKIAVQYLSNKDQRSLYWEAARFNNAALMAQMEEYNYHRPLFEKGLVSSDILGLLKQTSTPSLNRTAGTFDKPSDYMWFSACRAIAYGQNEQGQTVQITNGVDLLSDAEWAERRSDPFEAPASDLPILKELATKFKFYPTDVLRIELDYLKLPSPPVWGYTVVSNIQVYDSATSTDFTLPPHLFPSIVWRICRLMGITVRQEDLVAISSGIIPQVDPQ